jgi:hypothetical protein
MLPDRRLDPLLGRRQALMSRERADERVSAGVDLDPARLDERLDGLPHAPLAGEPVSSASIHRPM